MSKSRHNVSIEDRVWNQLEEETDNVSAKLNELARSWLNATGSEVGELQERKAELKDEIQNTKNMKQEYEQKMADLESKLSSIESELERKDKEESRVDNAVNELVSDVPIKTPTGSRDIEDRVKEVASTPKFDKYLEKTDVDRKELQEKLVAKVKA